MPGRRFHVVFNPKSGTSLALGLTCETLAEKFAAHGIDATIDDDDGLPLEERIARAIASDAEVIVAGGGDGTVVAVAEHVIPAKRILAILPLGTMNAQARDLSLPLDLDQAIAAMANGEPHGIDVGEVNGRLFLENVAIGFVTPLAALREQVRGKGFAAWLQFLRHCIVRMGEGRRIAVEVTPAEGTPRIERVRAIVIANGPYGEVPGRIMAREWINDGLLSLYVFRRLGVGDAFRIAFGMLVGRWKNDEAIAIETARSVAIRVKRPSTKVILDGEVVPLEVPLNFSVRPLALQVLLPAPPVEPAVDAPVAVEA
jgi:diacylglycerol kinase family enzyme